MFRAAKSGLNLKQYFKLFGLGCLLILWMISSSTSLQAKEIKLPSANQLRWYSHERTVFFNIPVTLSFALKDNQKADDKARKIIHQVDKIYKQINQHFNAFDKNSELRQFNQQNKIAKITVSKQFHTAFEIAQQIYTISGGAFDISIWPLKALWTKAAKTGKLPGNNEIKKALESCGLDKIAIGKHSLKKQNGSTKLDFGGIVKGYAVDEISYMLKNAGVENALIQCGGETRVFGKNHLNRNFKIGIQHPLENGIYGYVVLEKPAAISTSGNYRQPIIIGNKNYYHIFNPKNGQPVDTNILGVSVILPEERFANAKADGLATAITVMGAKAGLQLARKIGFDVLILLQDEDKKTIKAIMNDNLKSHFVITCQ